MTVPRGLLDGPIYLDYNATSPIARRATALHDLTDLFRHLHPEQVEHSWARRPELGYRYDHAHGSPALVQRLIACEYVHETRELSPDGSRLTVRRSERKRSPKSST